MIHQHINIRTVPALGICLLLLCCVGGCAYRDGLKSLSDPGSLLSCAHPIARAARDPVRPVLRFPPHVLARLAGGLRGQSAPVGTAHGHPRGRRGRRRLGYSSGGPSAGVAHRVRRFDRIRHALTSFIVMPNHANLQAAFPDEDVEVVPTPKEEPRVNNLPPPPQEEPTPTANKRDVPLPQKELPKAPLPDDIKAPVTRVPRHVNRTRRHGPGLRQR